MQLTKMFAAWLRATVLTVACVFVLVLLTGCASSGYQSMPYPAELPVRAELGDTPFFPDDSHYCGPAALATSLSAAGFPTESEELISQVFLPGRQGSLQIEMLSGSRRRGAVATVIPDSMQALFLEVAAGHPVVVLQNLGLSWAPSWHYAVVVGYDTEADVILLRSGPMKRQELSLRTFIYTWNRSDRWAFVTLRPDQLPATATQAQTVQALVAFERNAPVAASLQAYRTGLERWPNNPTLSMGLGNVLYASGDQDGAEAVFRQLIERHHHAAAYNNLARVLLERGNVAEARTIALSGLAVAGTLRESLTETLKTINATTLAPK